MVVRLPHGAKIVIDAKTPLDAYMEACTTEDRERQDAHLQRHAESLKGHAKQLGGKEYAEAVAESLDFTVMYVPSDPMLDAAMLMNEHKIGALVAEAVAEERSADLYSFAHPKAETAVISRHDDKGAIR